MQERLFAFSFRPPVVYFKAICLSAALLVDQGLPPPPFPSCMKYFAESGQGGYFGRSISLFQYWED